MYAKWLLFAFGFGLLVLFVIGTSANAAPRGGEGEAGQAHRAAVTGGGSP
jgi:hypothetical protein